MIREYHGTKYKIMKTTNQEGGDIKYKVQFLQRVEIVSLPLLFWGKTKEIIEERWEDMIKEKYAAINRHGHKIGPTQYFPAENLAELAFKKRFTKYEWEEV